MTQQKYVATVMHILAVTLGAARFWSKWAWRIYRLARTTPDKASLTRFILLRGLSRYTKQSDTILDFDGARYCVGVRSGEVNTLVELYKDRVYDRVREFIPEEGWVVFDIGANVGMFAVRQARRGAKVFAFEPNPAVYQRLIRTVAASGVQDKVQTFEVALGFMPSVGAFQVPLGFTCGGSVVPNASSGDGVTITVDVTSLDHILESVSVTRIDLLKIDVEGAEVELLHGAANALTIVQRIIVECHSLDIREQVINFLKARGFYCETQIDTNEEAGVDVLYAARMFG